MAFKKYNILVTLLLLLSVLSSCIGNRDIKVDIFNTSSGAKSDTKAILYSADIRNNQLTIQGDSLSSVSEVRIKSNSGLDSKLVIDTQNSNTLIAKAMGNLVIPLNTALSILIKDSHGATTYPLTFELQDGIVTAAKLDSMGALSGQVLMYDGTNWAPHDLSGLIYAGNWDANSGSAPNLSPGAGEYYIVNNAGTTSLNGINSWAVGDWAVWNSVDSQWEKIDNSTNVTSFNGRNGVVLPMVGDYNISDLAGIDLTGNAVGKVLKYNGTNWVPSDDLTGGAGSVTETELQDNAVTTNKIADGTITDTDINGSASIAQSKISGLITDLGNKLNLSGGTMSGHIDMNGSNIVNPGTIDGVDVSALSTSVSTNSTATSNNASAINANTTNISGNATDIAANTAAITNISNRKAETFGTACTDNQFLIASSGTLVCADPTGDLSYASSASSPNNIVYVDDNGRVAIGDGAVTSAITRTIVNSKNHPNLLLTTKGNANVLASPVIGFENNKNDYASIRWADYGDLIFSIGHPSLDNSQATYDIFSLNGTDQRMNIHKKAYFEDKIGVGLSNPVEKVEVVGNVKATAFIGDGSQLTGLSSTGASSTTNAVITADSDSNGSGNISFVTAGSEKATILNNGNMGIGVITPSAKLEVDGTIRSTSITPYFEMKDSDTAYGANPESALIFKDSGDTQYSFFGATAGAMRWDSLLPIYLNSNGSGGVYVNTNGRVGIGTTSPNSLLDVAGTIRSQVLCDETGAKCHDLSTGITPVLNGIARGSNTDPTIRFNTDTNTGFYSPGLDQVGISVGGVLDARFNSNAISFYKKFNVSNYNNTSVVPSLGTSSSATINSGTIVGEHVFDYGGRITPDRASIYLEASETFTTSAQGASLNFSTIQNGTTTASKKMTIANNGYIGIGSQTPLSLLHLRESDDTWNSSLRMDRSWDQTTDYFQMMYDYEGLKIRTMANDADEAHIIFKPLNSEAMRITESGKVGIGNTNPTVALSVNGDFEATNVSTTSTSTGTLGVVSGVSGNVIATFRNTSDTGLSGFSFRAYDNTDVGYMGFVNPSVPGPYPASTVTIQGVGIPVTLGMSNNEVMRVHTNGNVGIKVINPTHDFQVEGTAGLSSGTAWTSTSDIRLKDIRGEYEYGLEEVLKLHTVRFNYKKDNPLGLNSEREIIGFIAQEVEAVIPEAIKRRSDGYLELNVDPIHWAGINAIKDLNDKIESNKELYSLMSIGIRSKVEENSREISSLKEENIELKARVELLEKSLCELNPNLSICS